ncbi:hypothetical protein GCM10008920_03870 [Pediococcus acidilactici]|nr:hypothetical protein GCM10008920_03870 [Pediococcus acidilactici]
MSTFYALLNDLYADAIRENRNYFNIPASEPHHNDNGAIVEWAQRHAHISLESIGPGWGFTTVIFKK